MDDKLWTVTELAEFMRMTPASVATIRSRAPDRLPPPIAATGRPRWYPPAVMAWCQEQSRPLKGKGGRPRKYDKGAT